MALYDFLDGPPAPLNSQLMEKVKHYNCAKKNRFFNGTKCKIRFGNHRFNFQKKMGVNFFSRKIGHKGGGGGPRALCPRMQKIPIFIFEYFP